MVLVTEVELSNTLNSKRDLWARLCAPGDVVVSLSFTCTFVVETVDRTEEECRQIAGVCTGRLQSEVRLREKRRTGGDTRT